MFRPGAWTDVKLLFLCKRRPMGRDLLSRPYGRFFHIPRLLAARGHAVRVALLSHQADAPVEEERFGVHWIADSIAAFAGLRYMRRVRAVMANETPDWVVGFSDTYYGILAERLARKHRSRSLIDAYDNYESYVSWCKPLHRKWRAALRQATAVSVAGPALADLVQRTAGAKRMLIAPMAVEPIGFAPLPIGECRRELGLPADVPLVGYCGAIYPSRGIDVLFKAMEEVKRQRGATLVLSGRLHKRVSIPRDAIWLGYLPDDRMPTLLNSLDVIAVINKSSAFGNYSHPIKLYEAMSCGVPVVTTRTPATEWILAGHPELLVPPEDPTELARRLIATMDRGRIDYGPQPTWETVTDGFESFLHAAAAA